MNYVRVLLKTAPWDCFLVVWKYWRNR